MSLYIDHARGKLTATSVSKLPQLVFKDIKFSSPTAVAMKPYHAKITILNTGAAAYHGDVGLAHKNGSDWLDAVSCDVEPGETIDVNVTFLPKEAGTINYSVNDNRGNNLHQGTITVVEPDFSDNLDLIVTHSGIADLTAPQPGNSQSPYYNINGQRIIKPW